MSRITQAIRELNGSEMETVAHALAEELRGAAAQRRERDALAVSDTVHRDDKARGEAEEQKRDGSAAGAQSATDPGERFMERMEPFSDGAERERTWERMPGAQRESLVSEGEKAYYILRREPGETVIGTDSGITPMVRGEETRHMQMRDISDFFRRDSRRYDPPFTQY